MTTAVMKKVNNVSTDQSNDDSEVKESEANTLLITLRKGNKTTYDHCQLF